MVLLYQLINHRLLNRFRSIANDNFFWNTYLNPDKIGVKVKTSKSYCQGDYKIVSSEDGQYENEDCVVLNLQAVDKRATYDRIKYWISKNGWWA